MNFYIVKLVNESIKGVWLPNGFHGRSGQWTIDYDARYAGRRFGYYYKESAKNRLKALAPLHDEPGMELRMVRRPELFELLGVEDWAKGT